MSRYAKRVLLLIMRWEPQRGPSCRQQRYLPAFQALAETVEVLWIDDSQALLQRVQQRAAKLQPDLVYCLPYNQGWTEATVSALSLEYTAMAWFGDDQWRFDSFSSRLAPSFARVIITDPFAVNRYRDLGVEAVLSDWAGLAKKTSDLSREEYLYDESFVGSAAPARRWVVNQVRRTGIDVTCFGAGWSNGRFSFEQMDTIFRRSRINLNLSNSVPEDLRFILSGPRAFASSLLVKKRTEQVKTRNFEIPLAGGFQLTNYAFGLERHFGIGQELAIFSSLNACAQMIRFYLGQKPLSNALEQQGYLQAQRDHTYTVRLADMLARLWR